MAHFTFKWCHHAFAYTIWTNCASIITVLARHEDSKVIAEIASSSGQVYSKQLRISEVPMLFDDASRVLPKVLSGSIRMGDILVQLQFEPVFEYELQVALTLAAPLDEGILLELADSISEYIDPVIPSFNIAKLLQQLQTKLLSLQF
jgi:ribosomal protein S28E/S33